MTTNKLTKTQINAISLAVRYAAFQEHYRNEEWERVAVWGKMLLEAARDLKLTEDTFAPLRSVRLVLEVAEDNLKAA